MTDIVEIYCDDLPTVGGTLMAQQGFMKTKFVDQGITFSRFRTAAPRCGPDRASHWTGLQTWQHGVIHNAFEGAGNKWTGNSTIPTALQNAGYLTAVFGKVLHGWGVQDDRSDYQNVQPGWSIFHSYQGNAGYINYDLRVANLGHNGTANFEHRGSNDLGRLNPNTDYSTDLFFARAVDVINNTGIDTPLYLHLSVKAIHSDLRPADRHKDGVCSPGTWNPASWNEADVTDKPAYIQDLPLLPGGSQANLQAECRTLQSVSQGFEDIFNAMNDNGRTDVAYFFMSDNGFQYGEHRDPAGKNVPYVASRGIPLYVHWAGNMGTVPRTVTDVVGMIDIAPTIVDIAGTSLSHTPAGVSFKSKIQTAGGAALRDYLPLASLEAVDDIPPWIGIETKEGELYVKYHYGDRNTDSGRAVFTEYYDPADPDELVNKFGNPAFAVRQAELDVLWTTGQAGVKDRIYVEPILLDTFEDSVGQSGNTIPLVFSKAVPAGLSVVAVVFAGGALNVNITSPFTDSRGNTWTVLESANTTNAAIYFLHSQITIPIQVNDTATPTFSAIVDERRAVAFPCRNVHTTAPVDMPSEVRQGNSNRPISNSITTTQAGDLVIWAFSYGNNGGGFTEGSGWPEKYSYEGAGRKCGVLLDTVFDAATYTGTAFLGNTAGWVVKGISLKQAGITPPPPSGTNATWTTAEDAIGIAIEVAHPDEDIPPPGAEPPLTISTFVKGSSGRTRTLLVT